MTRTHWTLLALLLAALTFGGWRHRDATFAKAESARLGKERAAIADSLRLVGDALAESRAVQVRLAAIADSLARVARDRDAAWRLAKARGDSLRIAVLPDSNATPDQLRAVIAADQAEIAACGSAKATCEERRETAEAERDEARRETKLARDSTTFVRLDLTAKVRQQAIKTAEAEDRLPTLADKLRIAAAWTGFGAALCALFCP